MGTMYFNCPVCDKEIHFKDKKNVFPVSYKLKCKHCGSIFGFIPKIFFKANLEEQSEKMGSEEIEDILNFENKDNYKPTPIDELTSVIDEFERQQNVSKEKGNKA